MKIQEHINKISWTIADKVLFIVYGLVQVLQIRIMNPHDFGLYSILIGIHTWIFIVSDALALQSIIQFGMNEASRKKVNLISLVMHTILTMGIAFCVFFMRYPLSNLFNETGFLYIATYLPVLIALTIPRTYCQRFLFRDRKFKEIFLVDFAFFGIMSLITLYLLLTTKHLNLSDVMNIYFSGMALSSLTGILLTRKALEFSTKGEIRIKEILKFTIPFSLYCAIYAIPRNLDVLIIKFFFSTSVVGIYQSAKNLFRVFEEAYTGSVGLVYAPAVNLIEKKDFKGLNDLLTKSVSFMLVAFIVCIALIELGIGELVISLLLPVKYHLAIPQFNLLALGALGLPFLLISAVITALGKPEKVLKHVSISLVFSLLTFYLVGISGQEKLVPLGYIVFIFIWAILSYNFSYKKLGFKPAALFRAIPDTMQYLIIRRNKKKIKLRI